MVSRIPRTLARDVKKHQKLLRDLTKRAKRPLALKRAKNSMVGGSIFKTIKSLFVNVLNGKIPLAKSLSSKALALLKKYINSRNSDAVIKQNGAGVFSILASILPVVIPLVMKLFKKKNK